MKEMKTLTILTLLILAGCAVIPKPDSSAWRSSTRDPANGQFWNPTVEEQSKAEELGRWFAYQHLGLSKSDIQKMRADFTGWFRNGKTILWVQFYDPAFHQPLPSGGFESFSTARVNGIFVEACFQPLSQCGRNN